MKESIAFSVDNSLSLDLVHNWVYENLLDDWCLKDFCSDFLSFLEIGLKRVLFSYNGKMSLLNQGGVLLMDNWLMVFMDVLLINDRLVVLMNNVLVMFVENVLLVFNENIFVMLMDDILMDFLHNCGSGVRLSNSKLVSSQDFLSLVKRFDDHLFLMSYNDGCFMDCLNDSFSSDVVGARVELVCS